MKQTKFCIFDIIIATAIVVGIGLNIYGYSNRDEAYTNPVQHLSPTQYTQTATEASRPQPTQAEYEYTELPEATELPTPSPLSVPASETATLWGGHFTDAQWYKALATDNKPYVKKLQEIWDTATAWTGVTPLDICEVDITGVWLLHCGIAYTDEAGDEIVDVTTQHTIRYTDGGYVSDIELLAVKLHEEGEWADSFLELFTPTARIAADETDDPCFFFEDTLGKLPFLLFDIGAITLYGTQRADTGAEGLIFQLVFVQIGD